MALLQETFADGTSPLHRCDPRLRVLSVICYAFLLAVSRDLATLVAGLLAAVVMILIARLPPGRVVSRLLMLNVFNLLLFAMLPFTYEGHPLFSAGPFTGSVEGFALALQITLKSNAIVLAFIALVATMSIAVLGHTLNWLHFPEKLVYLLLIAYRYIFVLEQEYHRLTIAARVRGFHAGTNLHSCKTIAYLFGMLLVRAIARADRVYYAMLCRGFKGRFYCIHEFTFRGVDALWAGCMTLLLLLLVYFEWLNNLL